MALNPASASASVNPNQATPDAMPTDLNSAMQQGYQGYSNNLNQLNTAYQQNIANLPTQDQWNAQNNQAYQNYVSQFQSQQNKSTPLPSQQPSWYDPSQNNNKSWQDFENEANFVQQQNQTPLSQSDYNQNNGTYQDYINNQNSLFQQQPVQSFDQWQQGLNTATSPFSSNTADPSNFNQAYNLFTDLNPQYNPLQIRVDDLMSSNSPSSSQDEFGNNWTYGGASQFNQFYNTLYGTPSNTASPLTQGTSNMASTLTNLPTPTPLDTGITSLPQLGGVSPLQQVQQSSQPTTSPATPVTPTVVGTFGSDGGDTNYYGNNPTVANLWNSSIQAQQAAGQSDPAYQNFLTQWQTADQAAQARFNSTPNMTNDVYSSAQPSYIDYLQNPQYYNNLYSPQTQQSQASPVSAFGAGNITPTPLSTGTPTMATNPLSQIPITPTTNTPATPNLGVTAGSPQGGSLTQGSALPNITTTQSQATAAPQFYTDYLNQIAQQGTQAAQNAQYVGASPLQQQAFNQVGQNVGNYQPTLNNAINLASSVGQSNIVNALGNLNQQNIATNLSPQTTAGIVGAGQFGSTRGAQALGQTINAADIATQAQQAQAMQQDYANRLAAAGQLGNLAGQQQSLGLGDVNALATLGGQQQTIAQNQQLFPMQQLTNESQLLRGYTMPTSTSSSYTGPIPGAYAASPLQQIAGLGALAAGVSNTPLGSQLFGTPDTVDPKTGAIIKGSPSLFSNLSGYLTGNSGNNSGGIPASQSTGAGTSTQPLSTPVDTTGDPGSTAVDASGNAIGTYDSSGDYTPYIQN